MKTKQSNNTAPTPDHALESGAGAQVIINAAAGPSSREDTAGMVQDLETIFREHGIDATVRTVEPDRLEATMAQTMETDPPALLIGGGDGTVSTAARILAGTGVPLGILPMGTFNYFARYLGIPLDLKAAAQAIAESHVRDIDLVTVNDRTFISHASIGIYPQYVLQKMLMEKKSHMKKIPAIAVGFCKAFFRFPVLTMNVNDDGEKTVYTTPFLLIGNSEGALDPFMINDDLEEFQDKRFVLYVSRDSTRTSLLKTVLMTLFKKVDIHKAFVVRKMERCTIEIPKKQILVTIDGEVTRLEPPLDFSIVPKALTMFVPEMD
ncbi:MAG: diacylglycerol/lipid kinase family protein [Desulfovibrionales bacterium]